MNPQSYELNRVHLEDQLREAASHQRQTQQLQGNPEHHTALNTLGRQMIKLGEWLQNQ